MQNVFRKVRWFLLLIGFGLVTITVTIALGKHILRFFIFRYISSPPSVELERATVVLATPPCSYTGVRDIVDLAVARGGDISLLESLTSDTAGGIKQPRALLAEQFSTLKYALTRPNIQFLIYEVHTILPSETTEMIHQVVEYANQLAMEKYIREHLVSGLYKYYSNRLDGHAIIIDCICIIELLITSINRKTLICP